MNTRHRGNTQTHRTPSYQVAETREGRWTTNCAQEERMREVRVDGMAVASILTSEFSLPEPQGLGQHLGECRVVAEQPAVLKTEVWPIREGIRAGEV